MNGRTTILVGALLVAVVLGASTGALAYKDDACIGIGNDIGCAGVAYKVSGKVWCAGFAGYDNPDTSEHEETCTGVSLGHPY